MIGAAMNYRRQVWTYGTVPLGVDDQHVGAGSGSRPGRPARHSSGLIETPLVIAGIAVSTTPEMAAATQPPTGRRPPSAPANVGSPGPS